LSFSSSSSDPCVVDFIRITVAKEEAYMQRRKWDGWF
jgi:hypothetical protein